MELWRPFPDCPDYEVSSLGRVRRVTSRTSGKAGAILRVSRSRGGYSTVLLATSSGKRKTFLMNRVVAEVFIGPAPSPKHQAAHWDGDKGNNAESNLRWATPLENAADKRRHGTHREGEACHQSKLTTAKVREVRMWLAFVSREAIARVYGVSGATIRDIATGRTWAAVQQEAF